jgi:hypothetical protein
VIVARITATPNAMDKTTNKKRGAIYALPTEIGGLPGVNPPPVAFLFNLSPSETALAFALRLRLSGHAEGR